MIDEKEVTAYVTIINKNSDFQYHIAKSLGYMVVRVANMKLEVNGNAKEN